jgi:hypothetical protein
MRVHRKRCALNDNKPLTIVVVKKTKETTMKKLMTILVLFALCGVAMASEPINLAVGEGKEYGSVAGAYSGLTYTVFESRYNNRQADETGTLYERDLARVYFTTKDKSADGTAFAEGEKITVQFVGAEKEYGISGYMGYDTSFEFTDYGIYMYNNETVGEFYSAIENGNSFKLNPGDSFGVYYVDKEGHVIGSTGLETTKHTHWGDSTTIRGFAGNFDDDPKHDITVGSGEEYSTMKHYMCLFEGRTEHWGLFGNYYTEGYSRLSDAKFEQSHFEFMLQTTLDSDYIPVNGQPLPGTLATLLIGGLCAKAFSKKNKKH